MERQTPHINYRNRTQSHTAFHNNELFRKALSLPSVVANVEMSTGLGARLIVVKPSIINISCNWDIAAWPPRQVHNPIVSNGGRIRVDEGGKRSRIGVALVGHRRRLVVRRISGNSGRIPIFFILFWRVPWWKRGRIPIFLQFFRVPWWENRGRCHGVILWFLCVCFCCGLRNWPGRTSQCLICRRYNAHSGG
uniref:Uncharacterized protein n=1 Tax=Opuntia streptacantha TaxID=393608 RepID=A0A7C9CQG6_OPUST